MHCGAEAVGGMRRTLWLMMLERSSWRVGVSSAAASSLRPACLARSHEGLAYQAAECLCFWRINKQASFSILS